MTYHRIFDTTGAVGRAESAYPSRASEFVSGF